MPGSNTKSYTTYGSSNIDFNFQPTTRRSWQLEEMRLHLGAVPSSSGAFTMTLDHATSTKYDVVLFSENISTSVSDVIYSPDKPIHHMAGHPIGGRFVLVSIARSYHRPSIRQPVIISDFSIKY